MSLNSEVSNSFVLREMCCAGSRLSWCRGTVFGNAVSDFSFRLEPEIINYSFICRYQYTKSLHVDNYS